MSKLYRFITENALMSMLIVLWLMSLVTAITLKVFFDPPDIPAGTVAAYGTVFGGVTIAVGVWKWRREQK